MMKGHYDDHLSWPFKGTVIIQLSNCYPTDCVFDYKDSDYGNEVTSGE